MSENYIAIEAKKYEKHQEAVELHRSVMLNAELAATSFIHFCEDLKKMRDTKLYEELDFASFEEYTVNAVGLKQRQAYNYINIIENLTPKLLENNSNLGVTKLGLLVQVPSIEQEDFAADHDLAGMTVDEIREAVKRYHDQSEQLSLLEAEIEELKAGAGEISPAQREAIEREARAAAEKAYKDKIKEIKNKAVVDAQKDMETKLADEKEKAAREALTSYAEDVKTKDAEVVAARIRQQELEKRLAIANDQTMAKFSIYFEDLQITINKMMELIDSCDINADKEKLRGALTKYFDVTRDKLNE